MATLQHLIDKESPESTMGQRLPTHGANPQAPPPRPEIPIKKIWSGAFKQSSRRVLRKAHWTTTLRNTV